MPENKTKPTTADVTRFLNAIPDERKRQDAFALVDLMRQVTKAEPKMWGSSIVGFGEYRYRYESGREGEWMLVGFSPRKQALTLYIMGGFEGQAELLARLGKHTTGKACLYVKRLDDLHTPTLKKLIRESVRHVKRTSV
jgi:hypothetical protein